MPNRKSNSQQTTDSEKNKVSAVPRPRKKTGAALEVQPDCQDPEVPTATAVYASLKEWETGSYIPAHFTTNIYADIYQGHIKDLDEIEKKNEPAFQTLLQCLFRMAANTSGRAVANDETITDINNMAIDL